MGPHLPEATDAPDAADGGAIAVSTTRCSRIPVLHGPRRGDTGARASEWPAGYEPPPMICAAVNPPDARLFFPPPGVTGAEERRRHGEQFSAFCSCRVPASRDRSPREKH